MNAPTQRNGHIAAVTGDVVVPKNHNGPRSTPDLPRRAYTTAEVAAMLGVSRDLVLDMIHDGRLVAVRTRDTERATFVVPVDAFEALLKDRYRPATGDTP